MNVPSIKAQHRASSFTSQWHCELLKGLAEQMVCSLTQKPFELLINASGCITFSLRAQALVVWRETSLSFQQLSDYC